MSDAALPTVLIVDDDDDIRLGLRHMLTELEDFVIAEVGDGQSALDAMVDTQFDLLMLDINLPKVKGDVVLTMVGFDEGYQRPRHIVIMSAAGEPELIKSRPEAVIVDRFIAKPFRYEELQEIVTDITQSGELLS